MATPSNGTWPGNTKPNNCPNGYDARVSLGFASAGGGKGKLCVRT